MNEKSELREFVENQLALSILNIHNNLESNGLTHKDLIPEVRHGKDRSKPDPYLELVIELLAGLEENYTEN